MDDKDETQGSPSGLSDRKRKARRVDLGPEQQTRSGHGHPYLPNALGNSASSDEPHDATPRPSHPLNILKPPNLPPSSPTHLRRIPRSTRDAAHSESSVSIRTGESGTGTDTGTGSKRKRAGDANPSKTKAKKLDDQQYTTYPVSTRTINRIPDLPASIRPLVLLMRDIGKAEQILHRRHVEWRDVVGTGVDKEDNAMFTATYEEDNRRDALGQSPSLDSIRGILHRAERSSKHNASEASWNCAVHAPLLEAALKGTPHYNRVMWENVTTARIYPTDLLPTRTSSTTSETKRVDFCFALELDDHDYFEPDQLQIHENDRGINTARHLFQAGIESLNHTDYTAIRYNPVSVSIESKTVHVGSAEATLQMNTWASAQVTFLKRMLVKVGNPNRSVLPLPEVIIVGHEWKMHVVEDCGSGAVLWTGVSIGQTDSLRGIYQIIAGLQLLIQWSEKIYRPWFGEHILIPLIENVS